MKRVNRKTRIIFYLLLAVFMAFMMNHLLGTQTAGVKEFNENEAKFAVKEYLNANLRDPDSYEAVAWSKLDSVGIYFKIDHRYRAKNGFGGYNVETKTFVLTKDGKVISVY